MLKWATGMRIPAMLQHVEKMPPSSKSITTIPPSILATGPWREARVCVATDLASRCSLNCSLPTVQVTVAEKSGPLYEVWNSGLHRLFFAGNFWAPVIALMVERVPFTTGDIWSLCCAIQSRFRWA